MGFRMTPVGGEEPGPRRSTNAVLLTFTGVLVAGVALVATVAVVAAVALARFGDSLSDIGERRHLKPIPISTTACPYVALMHAAANDFQAHEPMFGIMFDADGQVVPIARERAIVDPPLARFELALAISKPHFPPRVRTQLAITQDAARQGRVQLAHASDSTALVESTSALLSRGQQAFGFASDLVGTQCGHGLGADSDVGSAVIPATTLATTASRS